MIKRSPFLNGVAYPAGITSVSRPGAQEDNHGEVKKEENEEPIPVPPKQGQPVPLLSSFIASGRSLAPT